MNLKLFVYNNVSRNLLLNNAASVFQIAKFSAFNKPIFSSNLNDVNTTRTTNLSKDCLFIPLIIGRGFKGGKKKSKGDVSSDDDDDENEGKNKDSSLTRDSKVVTALVTTMRADAIYKAIQKTSRSKIDVMFYEGRLRINGKLLMKKSTHINIGDEMDIVKDLNKQNEDFLNISRIDILSVKAGDDVIEVKGRYYKSLLVENYEENPWTPDMKVNEDEGAKKS